MEPINRNAVSAMILYVMTDPNLVLTYPEVIFAMQSAIPPIKALIQMSSPMWHSVYPKNVPPYSVHIN